MPYIPTTKRRVVAEDLPETAFSLARAIARANLVRDAAFVDAFEPRRVVQPGEAPVVPELRPLRFPSRPVEIAAAGRWLPPSYRGPMGDEFHVMRPAQLDRRSVGFLQLALAAASALYAGKRKRDKEQRAREEERRLLAREKRRAKKREAEQLGEREVDGGALSGLPSWVLPVGLGVGAAVLIATLRRH